MQPELCFEWKNILSCSIQFVNNFQPLLSALGVVGLVGFYLLEEKVSSMICSQVIMAQHTRQVFSEGRHSQ